MLHRNHHDNLAVPIAKKDEKINAKERLENPTTFNRLHQHMFTDINTRWADLLLITCFFVSGLVDSVAFNVWACFVSMQTGNTVFIALGASGQPISAPRFGWTRSLTTCGVFLFGAFCFANYHRYFGTQRRIVLFTSFLVQSICIAIAASIATAGIVANRGSTLRTQDSEIVTVSFSSHVNWRDLVPLSFLAFQGAGQIVASRALQYQEIPTVVLTSLYCDLMSDPHLFTASLFDDPRRNRRFAGAISLFTGAVSGGFFCKSWVGLSGALWLACFLKACIALAWLFWRAVVKKEDGSTDEEKSRTLKG